MPRCPHFIFICKKKKGSLEHHELSYCHLIFIDGLFKRIKIRFQIKDLDFIFRWDFKLQNIASFFS